MAGSTHNDNYKALLAILREVRQYAAMTQEELGKKLGNTQTFVSKMERGERRIDVVEFVEICSASDADPVEVLRAYLVRRNENSPPKSRSSRKTAHRT
jgi:transcriptional regulator with XRE-family HTH domain